MVSGDAPREDVPVCLGGMDVITSEEQEAVLPGMLRLWTFLTVPPRSCGLRVALRIGCACRTDGTACEFGASGKTFVGLFRQATS